jgi:DNA repair protein RecO
MSETTVQAIVLRRIESGETDRRLTIFSLELGKIDVVAKGARKAASRLAGISDPLSAATLSLASGKRNRFITQAQPLHSFRGLRHDYDRLTYALALAELYTVVLPPEEPLPDVFDLLARSLGFLEVHPKPLVALLWSQILLLRHSGFLPEFDKCVVSGDSIKVASPYVSPGAGGFVSEEHALVFVDRFRVRAEVLYGLCRLSELFEPPAHMKFVPESLATLYPFWQAIAEAPLAANKSVIGEAVHDRLKTTGMRNMPEATM